MAPGYHATSARRPRHSPKFPPILLVIALILMLFAESTTPVSTDTLIEQSKFRGHRDVRVRAGELTIGSDCAGSEGQWNCMTDSFQRCAAGLWSEVMRCADGTECTPAGLTYEFAVQYSGGGDGNGVTSGASGKSAGWGVGLAIVVGALLGA